MPCKGGQEYGQLVFVEDREFVARDHVALNAVLGDDGGADDTTRGAVTRHSQRERLGDEGEAFLLGHALLVLLVAMTRDVRRARTGDGEVLTSE